MKCLQPAIVAVCLVPSLIVTCSAQQPEREYGAAIKALDGFITGEMKDKALPSLALVLVDDQQIVWAKGFGHLDAKNTTAASADTSYPVGSVSKVFTDIAVMQLVEKGILDL